MTKTVPSLLPCIDSVLGVREAIGADKQPVQLVTRVWAGRERGDGDFTETVMDVRPTPMLRSLDHSIRGTEGGFIKQTDLIIKSISQNQFPQESDVDCQTSDNTVEKFYRIGQYDYRVISVVQRHVTWDVQVRRMTTQRANSDDWRNYEGS